MLSLQPSTSIGESVNQSSIQRRYLPYHREPCLQLICHQSQAGRMPSRPVSKSPLKNMVRRLRDLAHIMDSEKSAGMQEHLPGYPSLASFIASDPDQTSAIYKRFDQLASRHLLHLQSQLAELEAEQDRLDRLAEAVADLWIGVLGFVGWSARRIAMWVSSGTDIATRCLEFLEQFVHVIHHAAAVGGLAHCRDVVCLCVWW
jgi:hypothetical protein